MNSGYDVRIQRSIVLVLGNGFDMDLGLRTSYKDFWESEHCPKSYPAPLIKHLNEKWHDSLDQVKWYDLENELLKYFRKTNHRGTYDIITPSEQEFLKNYNPSNTTARHHYTKYQEEIASLNAKGLLAVDILWGTYITIDYLDDLRQSAVWRDRKAFKLIKEGLCKYITEASNTAIDDKSCSFYVLFALARAKEIGDSLQIYTFNYTSLQSPHGNSIANVTYHMHGTCVEDKIIIGTQDSLEFDENYDFLQKSFDPDFNPPALVDSLLHSGEIVIFGHSLGINDMQYFKSFFQRQIEINNPKRKRITIFTRDDRSEIEIKRSLQLMTDHNLSTLYGLNDLTIIKTANIKDDPSKFKAFMKEYIGDDKYVNPAMEQLLEKLRSES